MNNRISSQIDNELARQRLNKALLWGMFFAILILMYMFMVSRSETEGSYVIGETVGRSTSIHDEGHTNYLKVEVPTEKRIISVVVPHLAPIQINKQVKLRRIKNVASGRSKYIFVGYIEGP